MRRLPFLFVILAACRTVAPPAPSPELPRVTQLAARADVQAALDHVEQNREAILREWAAITEINAPSGLEAERAAYVESLLRAMSFASVERDAAGNVIAVRKGSGGGPTVVLDAHLDTVFQPGQSIEARIEEGRLHAPGVGDNAHNIEAILAAARALDAAGIRTKGDLVLLFTVEEETNFKGVFQFLADRAADIDHFIALDGGYAGFTYAGFGTNWYRFHFIGPGGHTMSSNPPYSAALPAARAIARIYQLKIPRRPRTHLNVGMLSGAEVVNAKAVDAWFSVDLRSIDAGVLADLDRRLVRIAEEEARRAGVTFRREVISSRPPAVIPGHRESYLVRTAEAVYATLGFENPSITPTASNNASVALRAGVSSIATGTAPCRAGHSLAESCEIEPFYRGIKKLILLAMALADGPRPAALGPRGTIAHPRRGWAGAY